MNKIVVLADEDNVATCLTSLDAGAPIELAMAGETLSLVSSAAVPFGHKVAIRPIAAGQSVLKYGEVIGRASVDIAPGEWVHVHNIESVRARGDLR